MGNIFWIENCIPPNFTKRSGTQIKFKTEPFEPELNRAKGCYSK